MYPHRWLLSFCIMNTHRVLLVLIQILASYLKVELAAEPILLQRQITGHPKPTRFSRDFGIARLLCRLFCYSVLLRGNSPSSRRG